MKICFVLPHSYSLFSQKNNYYFGGSETRGYLFGTGLSKLPNYEVSFVVLDHGQPEVEQFDNIRVYRHSYYKSTENDSSFLNRFKSLLAPYIDHLKPVFMRIDNYRISWKKINIYKKINADIYCTFGVSDFTAELVGFCKQFSKRILLFTGSGEDFSEKYYQESKELSSYGSVGSLCYFSIINADYIITQKQEQADILKSRFGKTSTIISNPIDLNNKDNCTTLNKGNKGYALWIGKSDNVKRPDIFLTLAQHFPEIEFFMVMNKSKPDIHKFIYDNKTSNINIVEYVPFNDIEAYFKKASVLVNTSTFEGFPNTFLQAGKYGVPVLSLNVDPDKFISKNKCGIVAHGNREKLKEGLITILNNNTLYNEFSQNIRQYVYENHNLNDKVLELHGTFQRII